MDVHRLNGYFVALERKCAPACHCICKSTGYGIEREICSQCSKPIDYMEFDNDTQIEQTCTFAHGGANFAELNIFFMTMSLLNLIV